MHFKFFKNTIGLILYSSIYSSLSTSLLYSATKSYNTSTKNNAALNEKQMFNLGSFEDDKFHSGELTLYKSELTTDVNYKLVVESQMTTGSVWFCADVCQGTDYKFNTQTYKDLKVMLTTDYKSNLARNGLFKHDLKVEPFRELEEHVSHEPGFVGFKEKSYTFLTVSKDVKVGDYVLLFAYGRTFSDDLPQKFKQFRVKVL